MSETEIERLQRHITSLQKIDLTDELFSVRLAVADVLEEKRAQLIELNRLAQEWAPPERARWEAENTPLKVEDLRPGVYRLSVRMKPLMRDRRKESSDWRYSDLDKDRRFAVRDLRDDFLPEEVAKAKERLVVSALYGRATTYHVLPEKYVEFVGNLRPVLEPTLDELCAYHRRVHGARDVLQHLIDTGRVTMAEVAAILTKTP